MGQEKKPKPLMEPLGLIKLDSLIIYDNHEQSVAISDDKCFLCKSSDGPCVFLDLELVDNPNSSAYRGLQLHLGFKAKKFHRFPARKVIPQTRIDVYLSLKEVKVLHARLEYLLSKLCMLE